MMFDARSVAGLTVAAWVTVLWLVSLLRRDSSIVDSFWGLGFVAVAASVAIASSGGLAPRAWLLAGLVAVWGLRLSHCTFWRNKGKGEDYRYRTWREEAGAVWWGHYLVAAASGAWWTIFSPALMTFLLVRVSGVSMLESAMRDSKPGYREYNASTSAFFPLPPSRSRS